MNGPGKLRAAAVALGVAVAAMVMQVVAAVPAVLAFGIEPGETAAPENVVVLFVASYAGMVLAVWGYLRWSGRGWSYLDVRTPTRRDLLYVVGGTVGGFAALTGLGAVVELLGLPTTPNAALEPAFSGGPSFLLVLVPLVLFVNAPVEELVFRNVVQKRLYGAYGKGAAVVLASLVFAVVHLPVYYNPDLRATGVMVALIFAGSLVFGWVYARTENLVVPTVVHGLFNAIQILLLYVYLTSDLTLELLAPV
ncbi:CPBP family intramembrane metalloprotease [Halobacteriales archaeon QS_1_68_20]|nr:MAG: CPBP family intramembrane metalloprotease [Halobacteriales archaeon QS_1_68_20]